MRSALFILLALFVMGAGSEAHAEKRIALIVGMSKYQQVAQLANPARDAEAVSSLFKRVGFDVVDIEHDLSIADFRRAIRNFSELAKDADIAVIYYAGHGIEVDGVNYLIPTDAKLVSDFDIEDETISLDRVLKALEGTKRLKLVILDACRDNPFAKTMSRTVASRSIGRGLAKVEPAMSDTLIAFAAKAGAVASDGDGDNSPFATALVKYIAEPGLDLRIAFGRVRDEVLKNTEKRQEPFVYGSLGGETMALVPKPVDPDVAARVDYGLAAQVSTIEAWQSFLRAHSNGLYADLARAELNKLQQAQLAHEKADEARRNAEAQAAQKAEELRKQLEEQSARQTAEAKQKISDQAKKELEETRRQVAEQAKKDLDDARKQVEAAQQQAEEARNQLDEVRRQAAADAQAQVERAKREASEQAAKVMVARVDYELAAQVSTMEAWQSFLRAHSNGLYADLAQAELNKLQQAQLAHEKADEARRNAEVQAAQKAGELRKQLEEQSARQTAEAKQKISDQAKKELEETRRQVAEQAKKDLDDARTQVEAAQQQAEEARKQLDEVRRQAAADAQAQVERAKRETSEEAAKVASLTPAQAQQTPSPQIDASDIARLLQAHLKRVGCNPGNSEGNWDESSREALALFNQNAQTKFDVRVASLDALDAVRSKKDRVCPLVCAKGQRADGDRCVQIGCASGYFLNSSGACERRPEPAPKPREIVHHEVSPKPPAIQRSGGGGKCFNFSGKTYCE